MCEEQGFEPLVRLRLLTSNQRVVDARKEQGMTGEAFAAKTGIKRYRLRYIENLRVIPTEQEMVNISVVLGIPVDHLFPESLLSSIKEGVFGRRKVELDEPQIISLAEAEKMRLSYDGEADMIEEVDRKLLVERLAEVLQSVNPQERKVLELRFGLGGGYSHTNEEVGRIFNLTRGRIQQIEHTALKKLKHPSRARMLKEYL